MGFFTEEAKQYEIDNRMLKCHHCENTTFFTRTEQLHGPTTTFLNIEWADRTATCFVCADCGFIHWFMR